MKGLANELLTILTNLCLDKTKASTIWFFMLVKIQLKLIRPDKEQN